MKKAEYGSIDLDCLLYGDVISMAEALSDVGPIDWPDAVLDGTSQVVIQERHSDSTSY